MQPRAILSPVDFSEYSRHALRWAGAFAARFQSRLTVISVVDPLLVEAARIRLGLDLAKAETEPALREFIAATLSESAHAPEQTVVKTAVGEAATAILETASADGADLIVMGTQGLGGFCKWLLGSTTERLLRRTHVPVLAVPGLSSDSDVVPRPRNFEISHILAAIDFSDSSVTAAETAVELSTRWFASLTLTHVVAPLRVPAQWQPLVEESEGMRVASARTKLTALAGQLSGTLRCEDVVVLGDPAEMIGSTAQDRVPVVEHGTLIGLVTMDNVGEFLMIHAAERGTSAGGARAEDSRGHA
jgi:nucleotide-binding universal stress UspA family protein